ncbi:right-handed parallel beta-helix repeat-containing protein [Actinomadura parmotrematis]|uniref:Right-handed parallel beta-helix repeat-containing protein n=1 Tax=Actinomadura parmotrematis TaxID=2864039 RepID=A0ABS7FMJ4_9ACTN|nr:right-handed parallel beta-helix repeat-containing protein [Actinomadura parmotrematis]MBW8481612.1 right-handed parallel beta-helix repeat-containing protein [Actinomadura parmotrematis]
MPHLPRRARTFRALALPVAVAGAALAVWLHPLGGGSEPPHTAAPVAQSGRQVATSGPSAAPAAPAAPGPEALRAEPAGSVPVGSAAYPVPDGAIMVAPDGDDGAAGTPDRPLRTVAAAVAKAGRSGTVVVRGGVYHESVTIPDGSRVDVRAYPHEAVWLDGSSPVTSWRAEDGAWVSDGWTARFDASPTYTKGAQPSGDAAFQFVSPDHPMAAHPDQLWVDGAAQVQVGSRGEVRGGTFYVDEGARRLYMGSDPRGHDVRGATLSEAVTVRGAGSALRGLGVRRYATSLPQMGTVKLAAPDVTVENVVVEGSATTGVSALSSGARLHRVTSSRNGLLGVHANQADGLRLQGVRTDGNNTEHFKYAPVSGGVKVTRSRDVSIVDSVAAGNLGKGFWLDESVYDGVLLRDRAVGNADHGAVLELGAKAVVAGSVLRDNGGAGLKVNDTSDVRIRNNTLAGNLRGLWLVQDARRRGDPGADPRHPDDPAMTWRIEDVAVAANVFGAGRAGAACLLCVEDATGAHSAAELRITAAGDRFAGGGPYPLVVWPGVRGARTAYDDLDRFRRDTGQEDPGAPPLPADLAALAGRPAGDRHVGAWPS